MIKWILLVLIITQASATVEDMGGQISSGGGGWPQTQPSGYPQPSSGVAAGVQSAIQPSVQVPAVVPTAVVPAITGCLLVSIEQIGPTSTPDHQYINPGKAIEYTVTVRNEGPSEVDCDLSINPGSCRVGWFSWTERTIKIPAGSSRSEPLQVVPDMGASPGDYGFEVEASAECYRSGSSGISFKVQEYDYASETMVSGTGQFQLKKDVRSMSSGIKSNKDIYFSGSVDALVKNEYLVDRAKGSTPNFEEQDAVDNYMALAPGDALSGTEAFKSSLVFGGIGARITESYNVQQMEFKSQNLNLYQTGSLGKMAEFRTADNFTGFYALDAKQVRPGQKSLSEVEQYLGSFEINRRILFKDTPSFTQAACFTAPTMGSAGCASFVNDLNALSKSAV